MKPFPAYSVGARRAVVGGLPANTVPPSISGTVAHGNMLTATPGTWTGSPSITGQWYAGASPISGATGTIYTCDRADGICGAASISYKETDSVSATSADSNDLVYTGADLPLAGFSLDEDVTVVSGEVDSIVASFGSFTATLTAPASTQRPAFEATGGAGGRPRCVADGVDDVLAGVLTKGSAWDTYEFGMVGERVSFGTAGDRWVSYGAGTTLQFALSDQSSIAARCSVAGGANVSSTTDPDGLVGHWRGRAAPAGTGDVTIHLGGTAEGTSAGVSVVTRADGGNLAFGARPDGAANAANVAAQSWYLAEALTADQLADLRDLLTRRTGVTS